MNLGRFDILTILSLSIHEQSIIFHLFKSSLINLNNIYNFLSVDLSCLSLDLFLGISCIFYASVNTTNLISFSNCLLLLYRNTIDFCVYLKHRNIVNFISDQCYICLFSAHKNHIIL